MNYIKDVYMEKSKEENVDLVTLIYRRELTKKRLLQDVIYDMKVSSNLGMPKTEFLLQLKKLIDDCLIES